MVLKSQGMDTLTDKCYFFALKKGFCFAESVLPEGRYYMIIASSDVGMKSSRVYRQSSSSSVMISTSKSNHAGGIRQNPSLGFGSLNFLGYLNYNLDSLKEDKKTNKEAGLLGNITDGNGKSSATRGASQKSGLTELENSAKKIRLQTLNYLFMLLFGERLPSDEEDGDEFAKLVNGSGSFETPTTISYEQSYTYEETETTTFSTTGKVVTADGNEIEFGIDVTMSRSFYQEYTERFERSVVHYLDPLVINLDGNVPSVSDQSFFFDLDCDGNAEEISSLGAGNGFLALDKNEDGIIGDGSELFGALTGNGFEELATYDLDGNGWIDEADEIFSRLRIFTKDENGKDILLTLKEADVGAICLKAKETPFNHTDENNKSRAMIRQSGVFLHENGMAGLVQQMDMAM